MKMCGKREPALMSIVELAMSDSAARMPAAPTPRDDPPAANARRVRRATPATMSPKLNGPASQIALVHTNGTMNAGHPGVYCENWRPSAQKTQKFWKARSHRGSFPYACPFARSAAWYV